MFSTLQFKKNSIYSNKRKEEKNKNRKQRNMTPQNPQHYGHGSTTN